MATRATPGSQIRSNVPSLRVLHLVNPIVSLILRSSLHRLISGQVLLLTYFGRRSGRKLTIPVNYTREGETLILFSDHRWWKNLQGGAPVSVLLQGRRHAGRANVLTDGMDVVEVVERFIAQFGAKDTGRRIGLALDDEQPPTPNELLAAMTRHVVVRLTLVS
jgi:hypothetical protein